MYINFITHVLQLDSLSTEAAITITFVTTFILTLTIDTVITFIVTYICVKQKFEKIIQDLKDNQEINTVLYDQIFPPKKTVSKDDLDMRPHPAYGVSHKVIMDTNPAYESCK